jgi:hypothetical protein
VDVTAERAAAWTGPAEQHAEVVLIAHQRRDSGCLCGWAELGKSHPGHQAAMLREAGLLAAGR